MRFFVSMLCLATAMAALAGAATERSLSISESILTGLHNSQDHLIAREDVELAQQRVNEAQSQILPKIDFAMSASRFETAAPTVLSPSLGSVLLPADRQDLRYSTRFLLWQYLYAGGRHSTTVRLSEINLSQARAQADAIQNKVIADVKSAFYTCVGAREKLKIYQSAVESGGPGVQSLSDRAQVMKYEYDRALLSFVRTVGLELDTTIELTGELVPPADDYEVSKCIAWAFQFRPELRQTQFQETIDSLRVNLSLAERFPTVALGASYEWLGPSMFSDTRNWNATINIDLPIFDGWALFARIKQRRGQAREAQIRRAQIDDQIRFDVRSAVLDYGYAKSRYADLQNQLLSDTDPLARADLEAVRMDALVRLLVAQSRLEWAIGKSSP